MSKSQYLRSGFTLIELLVVVMIIGILAAIALPQYKKVVMKANLHKGIPLVASLYEAQQLYYMSNGVYAIDLENLEIEAPHDGGCIKWTSTSVSGWDCRWGGIEVAQDLVAFFYPVHNSQMNSKAEISYGHILDKSALGGRVQNSFRYCLARPNNTVAQSVCQSIGGALVDEDSVWKYYEIK